MPVKKNINELKNKIDFFQEHRCFEKTLMFFCGQACFKRNIEFCGNRHVWKKH